MPSPAHKSGELPKFMAKQFEFAAHIRHPEKNPAPAGVEDRRMAVYRELFFNNIEDLLSSSFPVIRSLMTEDDWQAMMRDYYSRHLSHTPLFPEMPKEFLAYLEHERNDENDPPFLLELAHYEWMELAVSFDDTNIDMTHIDTQGDLLDNTPLLSPLVALLSYQYPVHQISPDFRPQQPGEQPTYLVVYRDLDDEVGFLELNPVTARLLSLLEDNEQQRTGRELLQAIAEEMQHPNPQAVVDGGRGILQDMKDRDIVLGTCTRK